MMNEYKLNKILKPRKLDKEYTHNRLPVLIEEYSKDSKKRISEEYFTLLCNFQNKLLRKYFKAEQFTDNEKTERVIDIVTLFIQYSREYSDRSGPWLIAKWRYILPDVLFYLTLRDKYNIKIEYTNLKNLFNASGLVSQLRQLEVISKELKSTGIPITYNNIEAVWLSKRKGTPKPNTLNTFREFVNHWSQLLINKRELEQSWTTLQSIQQL
ncbi:MULTISPECIES: hypothetical protein [Calothrix]|uniref:Uncharacterized protein n=2 Tax=Calothrix TaxID=1186 RepID=A0ABR8AJD5_9CYAN|nr:MULTISPECIES: hypothetical protein [Calothrix]MBD2200166.1 hypothetical protein [Calothrix parietina FACHB-288]MBD2229124.1 hypothetical protein [Calothrix anomala FACHB-343]